MTNKILAAGSVALMGAGALVGAVPAHASITDGDCGPIPTDAFLEVVDGEICNLTFDSQSATNWEFPTNVDRIAAVIIGGGAGIVLADSTGYAGGGGEVLYVNDVDTADIASMIIGGGGASSFSYGGAADGEDTVLGDNTAHGGIAGTDNMNAGWSGNGHTSWAWDGDPSGGLFAGGAKSAASENTPGAGYLLTDPELTENDPLFLAGNWTTEFGRGGTPYQIPAENALGWGGSSNANEKTDGADGGIIFRWIPGNADGGTDLAGTGVNTVPMGALAAGMLVAGGAGLAIARRARRSK